VLWIRNGFNADLDPAFISIRIQIHGAKRMRIHADTDPGRTSMAKSYQVNMLIVINFHAPGSRSTTLGRSFQQQLIILAYTLEDSIQLKKSIRSRVLRPAFDLGAHQLSWVSLLYFLTQPFFCRFPIPWYMVT
jgi:hypothetical protein